jgi:hypothetical protein
LKRSIVPRNLIGNETVTRFHFTDIEEYPNWWIVVTGNEVDVCVTDPGKEVDVHFTTDVRTMADVWMGNCTYRKAIADGRMVLVGPKALIRDVSHWMQNSAFAGLAPASEIG